jgi:endonuclease YncB( thermonuclease family)
MYDYNATVIRWIDGDTVVLRVDQGYYNSTEQPHRLVSVGTKELNEAGGPEALARVRELCPEGSSVVAYTGKTKFKQHGQTFTRWLASIELPNGQDLSAILLAEGLATPYQKRK